MKVLLLTESEKGLCFLLELSSIYFEGLIGITLDDRGGEASERTLSLAATCLRNYEQRYWSISYYYSNYLAS